jgi:tRNA (cmo5U34)-methyltransferase
MSKSVSAASQTIAGGTIGASINDVASEQRIGDADQWRTEAHARNWIARMDREAGGRDLELRTLTSFLSLEPAAASRILELGAGHGLLTRIVLERFRLANITALDLNPTMIDAGRHRLASLGTRVEFRQWDLALSGWPTEVDGPFDATISSLALHHLERQRKSELARQIFQRLRPGGLFLNLDYVGAASRPLAERYARAQLELDGDGDGHRGRGGHGHDPLEPQLEDLRQAGFVDVDVFWKRANLTLLGGTRPSV